MGDRRPNPGRVVELQVADEPSAWTAAGFSVDHDRVVIGPLAIRLTGRPADGARRGITGWTVSGLTIADGMLDGLATSCRSDVVAPGPPTSDPGPPPAGAHPTAHPNGAIGLDHIVVATPDLERTIAACEAAGLDLRRIREATSLGSPMRQAFFKLGDLVLELVSGDTVSGDTGSGVPAADAPATFFGLAFDFADLDETATRLGEGLGRIKPAVQRGRRIATLRHRQFGISVAIAAMDHHADRTAAEDDR